LAHVARALFIPAAPDMPASGAIYNSDGCIIEASRVTRGLRDASDPSVSSHVTLRGSTRVRGTYLYLGHLMPHFGHFLTETLAHWWALRHPVGSISGYVAHSHSPASTLSIHCVSEFLDIAGIKDKLVVPTEPTEFDHLIIPQASLQLESHVHTAYHETCMWLADSAGIKRHEESAQPVYISRRRLRKGIYYYAGEDELEQFFQRNGAKIIYPETMQVREQLALFRSHKNFFGIAGSGLHNIAFSDLRPRVHYFTPRWINPTCFLLDGVTGASTTYVVSTKRGEIIKAGLERFAKKIPFLAARRQGKFHRARVLDSKRVTEWLSRNGSVSPGRGADEQLAC
jgi:hypothetical protein